MPPYYNQQYSHGMVTCRKMYKFGNLEITNQYLSILPIPLTTVECGRQPPFPTGYDI